jgi:hypothetical protein
MSWVATARLGCHHDRLMQKSFGFWFYGGLGPA